MYQHIFVIGTDFRNSQRIAVHFSYLEKMSESILSELKKIKDFTNDHLLDVVIHRVQTEHSSYESVIEQDPYFEDIKYYQSVDQFLETLLEVQKIRALDVAEYILSSLGKCTNLKLQKLIYFSYEDFLLKTNRKLFNEKIVAYRYGPVVPEVYHNFKEFKDKPINVINDDIEEPTNEEVKLIDQKGKKVPKSAILSKFLSVNDGNQMIESIDTVLKKYGNQSAWDLVDESHRKNTPWDFVYQKQPGYGEIKPEIILEIKRGL